MCIRDSLWSLFGGLLGAVLGPLGGLLGGPSGSRAGNVRSGSPLGPPLGAVFGLGRLLNRLGAPLSCLWALLGAPGTVWGRSLGPVGRLEAPESRTVENAEHMFNHLRQLKD
eukprot:7379881-Pyramimonas_sp.AAC.1